jgi:hypothetical protein
MGAKKLKNHGQQWTPEEMRELKKLAAGNTPTRIIGIKLGRTEDAIASKASELGVSLKPTNQRPYGTSC